MLNKDNILEFKEEIYTFEKYISQLIDIDTIIYIYNKKDNNLYSNTFNIKLNLNPNSIGIINECFYTEKIHTIYDITNSFLYDKKIDNPLNIDIKDIMTIPIFDNSNQILGIIYIASKIKNKFNNIYQKIEHLIDGISISIYNNNKLSLIEYKPTILLIDDSFIIVKFIYSILQKYNFNIITATNGIDGINKFQNQKIDLIFIDDTMIGLSGSQTIKKIRNIEEKRRQDPIPIFGITSDTTKEVKDKILKSGANMVLYKPLTKNDIIKSMKLFMFL